MHRAHLQFVVVSAVRVGQRPGNLKMAKHIYAKENIIVQMRGRQLHLWSVILSQIMGIAAQSDRSPEYALVIDAGSSGSRIHVYKYSWNPNADPNRAFPNVELPDSKFKITPGLSSFAENPQVTMILPKI